MRRLTIAIERFPLAAPFVISRGAKTEAVVVTAAIEENHLRGRGECVPYGRYGETPETVAAQIEAQRDAIARGLDRAGLVAAMPAGAARNALDCALWDLEAKQLGLRAHQLAGLHRLPPVTTAFTLSVGTPDEMARAAMAQADRPVLKIKLGGDGDRERIAAVRAAAPLAELIVDANEAWSETALPDLFAACRDAQVRMIEQPLPEGQDAALRDRPPGIPVCADESVHEVDDLDALHDRYDAVNIKLDKAGGLTHALDMAHAAQGLGFSILVGSMVGTSLAMAPALLLAPLARFVDLDGPLLLMRDREPPLRIEGSILYPPEPALWG
jgi:L-alanine-DL-glutamate epimerase-like enolase superfamily enzyme